MSETVSRPPDDEFEPLADNAAEVDLPWTGRPDVSRQTVDGTHGEVAAIRWGAVPARAVFLHGGAQNAHTWDTVALALGWPIVAVDLPGHGRSAWRDDGDYHPRTLARAVARVVAELAPQAEVVVGMSLGGLTASVLAATHPELVRRLALIDVTPGVTAAKSTAITTFIRGPESFASYDEILARTIEHNPGRTESSLRRGVIHNARPRADGRWEWRWDPNIGGLDAKGGGLDFRDVWDDIAVTTIPLILVRGSTSPVVDEDDVAELRRLRPEAEVVVVDGAGHSIQGDRPLELAEILQRFVG